MSKLKRYEVTVSKQGTALVEAEDSDHAEQIARDQEADGCFWMDLIVEAKELPLDPQT